MQFASVCTTQELRETVGFLAAQRTPSELEQSVEVSRGLGALACALFPRREAQERRRRSGDMETDDSHAKDMGTVAPSTRAKWASAGLSTRNPFQTPLQTQMYREYIP